MTNTNEKEFLNEFLGKSADLGVTVENLSELMKIEDVMSGTFSPKSMVDISIAHRALVNLSITMEEPL